MDLYVGGTEHAVLHLLYARFWHKVLFDLGYVSTPEPFFKLVNQGLILGEDGQKMSKSRGNVVNPDDIVRGLRRGRIATLRDVHGAAGNGEAVEHARAWREFIGFWAGSGACSWTKKARRNLSRRDDGGTANADGTAGTIQLNPAIQEVAATPAQLKALHACIKKVTEDLDGLRFNTAISALMVFINEAMTWDVKPRAVLRDFLILLQPFAPHLAEELWPKLSAAKPSRPSSH